MIMYYFMNTVQLSICLINQKSMQRIHSWTFMLQFPPSIPLGDKPELYGADPFPFTLVYYIVLMNPPPNNCPTMHVYCYCIFFFARGTGEVAHAHGLLVLCCSAFLSHFSCPTLAKKLAEPSIQTQALALILVECVAASEATGGICC